MSRVAVDQPPPPEPPPEPAVEETPAWRQFIEERERTIRDRDRGSDFEEPLSRPEPQPWAGADPAPTFIEEPEETERVETSSWWPEDAAEPVPVDQAWALPDDDAQTQVVESPEDVAFPHPPPTPVPGPETEGMAPPPAAEHVEWRGGAPYQAPPAPADDEVLQHAPEAPLPDLDPEERAARRREQEEAARAYEQARDDQ
ncbi:MAG: hypothetical protein JO265_11385 [Acidimicrobiia bacterium]|nr:hypothetical protein [Acidimicrobiia bacterium]